MAAPGSINIEVVFALPDRQKLVSLSIDQACTVKEAILKSGIADEFPDQDIFSCSVGIWGRAVQEDQSLREGDRIEIYRSLLIDPRAARRQLAEHGGGVELESFCPLSRTVRIRLLGECTDCPKKGLTISEFIQETLREFVAEGITVVEV